MRLAYETYPSRGIRCVAEAVEAFLRPRRSDSRYIEPSVACVAAAGPVDDGACYLTNLGRTERESELSARLGFPTVIVNDFSALTRGVVDLRERDAGVRYRDLIRGAPPGSGSRALVLGAGTGLGAAFALRNGNAPTILSSEGGHAAIPAFDDFTRGFQAWMQAEISGFVPGAELAVSGQGVANLHRYACECGSFLRAPDDESILAAPLVDRPAMVAAGSTEACGQALRCFARLYARVASDLCVAFLADEVWLGGGIASKTLPLLAREFPSEFVSNYREALRARLARVPVRVVTDYSISLDGAAALAFDRIGRAAQGGTL
jgi:glucokinase